MLTPYSEARRWDKQDRWVKRVFIELEFSNSPFLSVDWGDDIISNGVSIFYGLWRVVLWEIKWRLNTAVAVTTELKLSELMLNTAWNLHGKKSSALCKIHSREVKLVRSADGPLLRSECVNDNVLEFHQWCKISENSILRVIRNKCFQLSFFLILGNFLIGVSVCIWIYISRPYYAVSVTYTYKRRLNQELTARAFMRWVERTRGLWLGCYRASSSGIKIEPCLIPPK